MDKKEQKNLFKRVEKIKKVQEGKKLMSKVNQFKSL